MENSKNLDAK